MMIRVAALKDPDGTLHAWDPVLKNNDHYDFFLRQQERGLRVYVCPHVNVMHDKFSDTDGLLCRSDNQYMAFRDRWSEFLPYYFTKWRYHSVHDYHHNKRVQVIVHEDGRCVAQHLSFSNNTDWMSLPGTHEGRSIASAIATKVVEFNIPEPICRPITSASEAHG
jgi:hypothetical protein